MLSQRAQAPSTEAQMNRSISIFHGQFLFFKYFVRKNWQRGGKLLNCY